MLSRTRFRVNLHSIVAWMPRVYLQETGAISEVYVTATGCEFESRCCHIELFFFSFCVIETSQNSFSLIDLRGLIFKIL